MKEGTYEAINVGHSILNEGGDEIEQNPIPVKHENISEVFNFQESKLLKSEDSPIKKMIEDPKSTLYFINK